VFVSLEPTNLRRSFDGLAALVSGAFGRDVFEGDAFVFLNRRATQVRVLYWDGEGYCIWMKRLEAGTFRKLQGPGGQALLEVDAGELAMLLCGIDAASVKRRKRYTRAHENAASKHDSHLQF
jgi:transposase